MQKLFVGILSIMLLLLAGCTSKHLEIFPELSDPSLHHLKIAPELLREDVDALISGITKRHPDVSAYADLDFIHKKAALVKAELTEPMTRVEFYKKVGALSHLFNDGHTFLIWPYQEYQVMKENGALVFPFALDVFPEGVFIKHEYDYDGQTIPKGTKLLSINDVEVETIFNHAQQFVGGETRLLRNHVVAARFPQMIWAVFGFVDTFKLALEVDSQVQFVSINLDDNWLQSSQAGGNDSGDFVYQTLSEDVGYLKVATFDVSPARFEDFVDETFLKINQQNIKTLIIDIRENGGGNTDTATYLTAHLATSPFRMISSMRERLNTENRGLFNYRGDVGEMLQEDWNEWVQPINEDKRFKGNTYLLVSPLSYSSAIVFATALQDNNIATIVGRETGGYANQTAQGNLFNLPNSELRVYVATRLLVRPNGHSQVSGVIPDVEVTTTNEQIKAGVDADIQAALEHAIGL